MARPTRSKFGAAAKVVGVRFSAAEEAELMDGARLLDAKTLSELVRKLALEGVRSARAKAAEPVTVPALAVVVGCGGSKAGLGPDVAIEARRLYCSDLFDRSYRLARNIGGGDIWIASARYGAIRPEAEILPYEHRLTADEAPEWAARVAERVAGGRAAGRAVLLMGEDYAAPLRAAFKAIGWMTKEPMKGLSIGKRLTWLNGELARHG